MNLNQNKGGEKPGTGDKPKEVIVVSHTWQKTPIRKVSHKGETYQITGVAHRAKMCRISAIVDGVFKPVYDTALMTEIYKAFKV